MDHVLHSKIKKYCEIIIPILITSDHISPECHNNELVLLLHSFA